MPLIHYWGFEGNANDMVGTNNGTINGAVSAPGVKSSALLFDGTNDYVSINSIATGLTSLSLSFWTKPTGVTGDRCVVSLGNNVMIRKNAAALYWFITDLPRSNTTTYKYTTVASMFSASVWHHFVITISDSTYKLFKNGVYVQDLTGGSNGTGGFGTSSIGGYGAANYYDGTIDEVAVWNEAIDVATIKNNYTYHKGYY